MYITVNEMPRQEKPINKPIVLKEKKYLHFIYLNLQSVLLHFYLLY